MSICIDCKQKLENAYEFRQQIISYDEQLRKLLGSHDSEGSQDTESTTKLELVDDFLYEIQEDNDGNEEFELKANSDDDDLIIKTENGDGFEEVDIPLDDDDFNITENAYASEENQVLASLAFSMPKPKDFTAPEDSRLLYRGTIRHYQCLKCENVYSPRNKIVNHLKTCDGKPKDDGQSGEFTERPSQKMNRKERKISDKEQESKEQKVFQCDLCAKIFKHSGNRKLQRVIKMF